MKKCKKLGILGLSALVIIAAATDSQAKPHHDYYKSHRNHGHGKWKHDREYYHAHDRYCRHDNIKLRPDYHGFYFRSINIFPSYPMINESSRNEIIYRSSDISSSHIISSDDNFINSDRYCREYQSSVMVGNKMQESYGTACMQPDGTWEIVRSE